MYRIRLVLHHSLTTLYLTLSNRIKHFPNSRHITRTHIRSCNRTSIWDSQVSSEIAICPVRDYALCIIRISELADRAVYVLVCYAVADVFREERGSE